MRDQTRAGSRLSAAPHGSLTRSCRRRRSRTRVPRRARHSGTVLLGTHGARCEAEPDMSPGRAASSWVPATYVTRCDVM
ncbi:hypothetical protein ACFOLD_13740 [Kocuria carniphila]|uniref:hypothetical protein n=1 Tax=Kocuria carniphila TaxID=262208 RepID=UPI00360872BE